MDGVKALGAGIPDRKKRPEKEDYECDEVTDGRAPAAKIIAKELVGFAECLGRRLILFAVYV
jgi:hypothetical protein